MDPYLLNSQLERYMREKTPVVLTLHNRVQLRGRIAAYDNHTLLLQGRSSFLVYRHAVAQVSASSAALQRPSRGSRKTAAAKPARKPPASKDAGSSLRERPSQDPAQPVNEAMGRELLKWMQRHHL